MIILMLIFCMSASGDSLVVKGGRAEALIACSEKLKTIAMKQLLLGLV